MLKYNIYNVIPMPKIFKEAVYCLITQYVGNDKLSNCLKLNK